MKIHSAKTILLSILSLWLFSCQTEEVKEVSLKDALNSQFLIGTALNTNHIFGKDSAGVAIIKKHFNSIVAENCMKSEVIHPKEDEYNFTKADRFIEFGEQNNMFIIGHTLIWHSQAPAWFFVDDEGNDVSRDVLIERMKKHIHTVVGRYKGRVKGWDVVNEAIEDNGEWRKSKFYTIIGEDYIKLAFQFAHEADPDAELYYNDYSMFHKGRQQGVERLIKMLREDSLRIDATGMQAHYGLNYPSLSQMDEAISFFSGLGVKVMITELDLSILPSPYETMGANVADRFAYRESMDPYKNGLTDSISQVFNQRYMDFFQLFLKHHKDISRVTLWGVTDADSWKNDWPIKGRTDYPLLFDRNYQAKPIVKEIIEKVNQKPDGLNN
ncbi:endo-1,4-beta-xylanase [Carboxylicivirga linearis]|uniref:Beta-xylanase n=1 Tax=Carboxylicivirga linearis TaxID=1628157 RepID=A0ABS5JXW0_9BACT|nr:endo-1,4-beta-xylanase [Carboxylicivirga linearis]MBS2099713.1 endo-1,4-beta-xylanase [Carboxylicivirga linearis]